MLLIKLLSILIVSVMGLIPEGPHGIRQCQERAWQLCGCTSGDFNPNLLLCKLNMDSSKLISIPEPSVHWDFKGTKTDCQACKNTETCVGKLKKNCVPVGRRPQSVQKDMSAVAHGGKCSHNEDCIIWDSMCFQGVCLCKLGHYFSRGRNTCIKGCSVYGKKMDSYKEMGIIEHNDKRVLAPNLASCEEKCVEEKAFICVTVDFQFTTGRCYLSVDGLLDVEEKDREDGARGWILSQRQCK